MLAAIVYWFMLVSGSCFIIISIPLPPKIRKAVLHLVATVFKNWWVNFIF